jgi:hypothetical protein
VGEKSQGIRVLCTAIANCSLATDKANSVSVGIGDNVMRFPLSRLSDRIPGYLSNPKDTTHILSVLQAKSESLREVVAQLALEAQDVREGLTDNWHSSLRRACHGVSVDNASTRHF